MNISHNLVAAYLRSYVDHFGLDGIASFNSRVELISRVATR
jgi:hypothetical protein